MASDPKNQPEAKPALKRIQAEALDRLADSRQQKMRFQADIAEAYFFASPRRCRDLSSSSPASNEPSADAGLVQISIAMEESESFATTLIQAFMPQGVEWADLEASTAIDEEFVSEFEEEVKKVQKHVFKVLDESNFYEELPRALNPDASVGTFGLMIERKKLSDPISVLAVPLRELEVNIGPDGSISERWAIRHTKARDIRGIIGANVPLSPKIEKKIQKDPTGLSCIAWGWWRDWSANTETWRNVILIDNELIFTRLLTGAGCCSLVVVTFNRMPEFSFGDGPLLKAAPERRHLDEMAAGEVDNIELSLRPPMTYPDDSFTNVSNGVEPGAWYPIRAGTEGAVKKMYEPNKLDAVYFDQQKREQRVRRLFYNDFPQQRGDTPPTATQWVDEMAMAQRKIGTPGLSFFAEGPAQIIQRILWLETEAGKVRLPSAGGKSYALKPNNSTKRAQDQQMVAMIVRAVQIAAQAFPEEFKGRYDGAFTIDRVLQLLGVEANFKTRTPDQVKQAVSMIQQLQGGAGGNTDVQPGQLGGPAPSTPGVAA